MASTGDPDDDARVELLRTHDPVWAEMLVELLEAEGITVATPGLHHAAVLGAGGGYVEVVVQVPRRDLERARQVLEALDAAPLEGHQVDDGESVSTSEAVGYRDSARGTSTVHGRRRRIAVAASMVLPGGGHVYVGEWRSAGIVALVEVLAVVSIAKGIPLVGAILPLAVVADALGGAWHCERLAGSARPSWRRFAPELSAIVLIATGALMVGPGAAWLAGPRSTRLCDVASECGGRDRRECLWQAASEGWEQRLPASCPSCLERVGCEDLARCTTCFE